MKTSPRSATQNRVKTEHEKLPTVEQIEQFPENKENPIKIHPGERGWSWKRRKSTQKQRTPSPLEKPKPRT